MNVLSSPDILNRIVILAIVASLILVVARILDIIGLFKHKGKENALSALSWFITACSFIISFGCLFLSTGYDKVNIINDGKMCIIVSCIPLAVWVISIVLKTLVLVAAHNKWCCNCEQGDEDYVEFFSWRKSWKTKFIDF